VDVGEPMTEIVRERYGVKQFSQGVGAEIIAQLWSLDRGQLDESAVESHRRATAANDVGAFADEIVPVRLSDGMLADTDGAELL
jgi:acetyl-CoA acetyltransferase